MIEQLLEELIKIVTDVEISIEDDYDDEVWKQAYMNYVNGIPSALSVYYHQEFFNDNIESMELGACIAIMEIKDRIRELQRDVNNIRYRLCVRWYEDERS